MARPRISLMTPEERLRGPSSLRPTLAEREEALNPPPLPLPTEFPKYAIPFEEVKEQGKIFLEGFCRLQHTLAIRAQPGVDIKGDLLKDVCALRSPCRNFCWGDEDCTIEGVTLRITLGHHNTNQSSNNSRHTKFAFWPTKYEPRDLVREADEIWSVDKVLNIIRSWTSKVVSCEVKKTVCFRPTYYEKIIPPDGMGNTDRFPAPWHENWEARLVERKEKEKQYTAALAKVKRVEDKNKPPTRCSTRLRKTVGAAAPAVGAGDKRDKSPESPDVTMSNSIPPSTPSSSEMTSVYDALSRSTPSSSQDSPSSSRSPPSPSWSSPNSSRTITSSSGASSGRIGPKKMDCTPVPSTQSRVQKKKEKKKMPQKHKTCFSKRRTTRNAKKIARIDGPGEQEAKSPASSDETMSEEPRSTASPPRTGVVLDSPAVESLSSSDESVA